MSRAEELKKLKWSQKIDKATKRVRHQIIKPTAQNPEIPFVKIKSPSKRAVFILHLANFNSLKISEILKITEKVVYNYISDSYRIYPTYRNLKSNRNDIS